MVPNHSRHAHRGSSDLGILTAWSSSHEQALVPAKPREGEDGEQNFTKYENKAPKITRNYQLSLNWCSICANEISLRRGRDKRFERKQKRIKYWQRATKSLREGRGRRGGNARRSNAVATLQEIALKTRLLSLSLSLTFWFPFNPLNIPKPLSHGVICTLLMWTSTSSERLRHSGSHRKL